ncbi:shikimate kinase [Pseudogracilibacillus auburnensis]|uniref:Shikimate kinase n=1 Tax=Pseudogracilibacillus auburnensis TaxID=1494959 RepID=A0A2V3W8H3_9BACI|nr:shikimate kinase [Pseudogracilibacillus auburnensis]MBO1001590.1 shikimate kinase [Pseudogracilibacillus auburnensis]PXW89488.1 shikimate kinase [Pseudogracilibacillus auburnensis]
MNIENLSMREKSLVFIGFMGVGKTTVAQLVAKKLYRDFVDIDLEIEREFGMPTTDIFKKIGERKFREKEKEYVLRYCKQPLKVISLGGGAFMQEDIRNACLKHSIVFYLDISWDSWKERLHMLVDSRPVLQDRSLEDIEELFNARKSTYEEHNSKLMTDHFNEEEVANYIIDSVKLAWDLHE